MSKMIILRRRMTRMKIISPEEGVEEEFAKGKVEDDHFEDNDTKGEENNDIENNNKEEEEEDKNIKNEEEDRLQDPCVWTHC